MSQQTSIYFSVGELAVLGEQRVKECLKYLGADLENCKYSVTYIASKAEGEIPLGVRVRGTVADALASTGLDKLVKLTWFDLGEGKLCNLQASIQRNSSVAIRGEYLPTNAELFIGYHDVPSQPQPVELSVVFWGYRVPRDLDAFVREVVALDEVIIIQSQIQKLFETSVHVDVIVE